MKFADFFAGQILEFGQYTVTEREIIEYAQYYDPQPFHIDKEFARRSRWNGLIASGWHTCSIAMRMVAVHVLQSSESIGSPGLDYLKWPNPLRPGDRLHMRVHVLEPSVSKSGRMGAVRWQWLLLNQDEKPVLDLVATSLFALDGQTGDCTRT